MLEHGYLRWRYLFIAFPIHLFVVFFTNISTSELTRNFEKWTLVLITSYCITGIAFAIANHFPWIKSDGKRELVALIVIGIVRGFAIIDVGLLLDLNQVKPYLLRPLNSAVAVPLWFIMIRFIVGFKEDFTDLFHELYIKNIKNKVDALLPNKTKLSDKELENIEEKVQSTLKPLRDNLEKVLGVEVTHQNLKRESLIIQTFIEEKLRPLSQDLWRMQKIDIPRSSYWQFLLRLVMKTKSRFGLAILPAAIYGIVGVSGLTNFSFAWRFVGLQTLCQIFIYLAYEYFYNRIPKYIGFLNISGVAFCVLIPSILDDFILKDQFPNNLPWLAEWIGIGWFLALALAFSIAQSQIDFRHECIDLLLKEIEGPSKIQLDRQAILADKYAKYLHSDIQSTLSSAQIQLNQASERKDAKLGRETIEKVASVLRRDHHQYAVGDAISPITKFQKIIDAWDGIATISMDFEGDDISDKSLLQISEVIGELTSNSVRHGKADSIFIHINNSGEEVIISFKDNGSDIKKGKKGLGTEILKEYALKYSYERKNGENFTTFTSPK